MSTIWQDEQNLRDIVSKSSSMSEVLSKLKLNINSGNYQTLKKYCLQYNIQVPKYNKSLNTKKAIQSKTTPLEELFSNRGIKVQGQVLRKKLVEELGREDVCVECSCPPVWNGKELVLEVDHIDGNIFNNYPDNLQILCPNCHSQTSTFRGRNSNKEIYNYCSCGTKISKKAKNCRPCSFKNKEQKTKTCGRYPEIKELQQEYFELKSMEKLGSKYLVSSNSIRKYIKNQGISLEDFKNKAL